MLSGVFGIKKYDSSIAAVHDQLDHVDLLEGCRSHYE